MSSRRAAERSPPTRRDPRQELDPGPSDRPRARSKWDSGNATGESDMAASRRRTERSRSPRPRDQRRPGARDERGRQDESEPRRRRRSRSRSWSRSPRAYRPRSRSPARQLKRRDAEPSREVARGAQELEHAGPGGEGEELEERAEEPDFNPSGKLAAETKTFRGVVLKYHEPAEARRPKTSWRLYVFKGDAQLEVLHIHQQSAYLFGRERLVADVPIDHPSSSKQHAVIQFRQVTTRNELGESKTPVKPFIIDLESANGTTVNGEKIPPSRYYELQAKDVIKFGFSTREFVLIPED